MTVYNETIPAGGALPILDLDAAVAGVDTDQPWINNEGVPPGKVDVVRADQFADAPVNHIRTFNSTVNWFILDVALAPARAPMEFGMQTRSTGNTTGSNQKRWYITLNHTKVGTSANAGYNCEWHASFDHIRLRRGTTTLTTIAAAGVAAWISEPAGTLHNLLLQNDGTNIKAFIDEVESLSVADTVLTDRSAGMGRSDDDPDPRVVTTYLGWSDDAINTLVFPTPGGGGGGGVTEHKLGLGMKTLRL